MIDVHSVINHNYTYVAYINIYINMLAKTSPGFCWSVITMIEERCCFFARPSEIGCVSTDAWNVLRRSKRRRRSSHVSGKCTLGTTVVSPPEMCGDKSHRQSRSPTPYETIRQLTMTMTLMWIQKIWMEKWLMHYWKCYEAVWRGEVQIQK